MAIGEVDVYNFAKKIEFRNDYKVDKKKLVNDFHTAKYQPRMG